MATTRVWNISDDPTTEVPPTHIVVLGKDLAPGQFVQVDDSRLKNAHKLKKSVQRKQLWVGMTPPVHYQAFKNTTRPPKAVLGAIHVQPLSPVLKSTVDTPVTTDEPPAAEPPTLEDLEKPEESGKRKKKHWG
jgi:hypothetical protein